ncbi:MAG TPA: serine hydrolase domain-containing protein [Sphingomonas sp.]|nr:serine hydrolase domain-containing protein [Sphingomonas sp.]
MTAPPRIDPAALDALLAPYDRSDAPGFAVGVALGGVPGYRRGVGMASIELPVVLSPGIRMRIGSTSKQFTALAVMLLAEEKRLSIDDSPRAVLPELPGWADAITLRQMMAHTSGMRDSLDLILHAAGPGVAAPPDIHLRTLAALDSVNFAPGTGWSYNNGAYALLSEIVTRVSGDPFADFLRERIFGPVGMTATMLRPLDTDLVPNSATLHVPSPAGGYMRGVFGVPIGGEGGIVSTVDDMLAWLRHMSNPVVGAPETWRIMRTPLISHGYGLGLIAGQHRGLATVHHAGAVVGGSCQMLKMVDHDLDIIVMSNGLGGLDLHNLVEAIIDSCISGLPLPENAPAEPITGIFYSAEAGRRLALEAIEGKQAIRIDGMTLPARRDSEGRLSVPLLPTDITVTPQSDTKAIKVDEFGKIDLLQRVEAPKNPNLDSLVGRYRNASAEIIATIAKQDDGKALLTLSNPLGTMNYALVAIGPALWEGRAASSLPMAMLLEVGDDGLLLTSGRTRRLWCERHSCR